MQPKSQVVAGSRTHMRQSAIKIVKMATVFPRWNELTALLIIILRRWNKRSKRKRTIWLKQWILKRCSLGVVQEERIIEDRHSFRRILRLTSESFTYLVEIFGPSIRMQDIFMQAWHSLPKTDEFFFLQWVSTMLCYLCRHLSLQALHHVIKMWFIIGSFEYLIARCQVFTAHASEKQLLGITYENIKQIWSMQFLFYAKKIESQATAHDEIKMRLDAILIACVKNCMLSQKCAVALR